MPSTPACRPSTQASASAVSHIGTDRMRRSVSIHAPGFGSRWRSAGTKPSSRNGSASPSPSPANTASAAGQGSTSAAPSAAPMNGPVHGVATNAASAPVANAPPAPPALLTKRGAGELEQPGKVERDRRPSAAAAARSTRGSCNWNAQPTALPPARSARIAPPSARHTAIAPAV